MLQPRRCERITFDQHAIPSMDGERNRTMDASLIIRIVAGVLFVTVLAIIVMRRKSAAQ